MCCPNLNTSMAKGENSFKWLNGAMHLSLCHLLAVTSPAHITCTALCHAEEKAGLLLAQIPWANRRWSPSTQLLSAADPTLAQAPLCDSPLLSLTYLRNGINSSSILRENKQLKQGKHKYFGSMWNLIIPHSFLCTWQLSQPQIWALWAHTMCSCTAIFNWHFPAKPQRFASDFSTWELPWTKHPTDPLNSHVKAHEASLQSPNRKENTRAEGFD